MFLTETPAEESVQVLWPIAGRVGFNNDLLRVGPAAEASLLKRLGASSPAATRAAGALREDPILL